MVIIVMLLVMNFMSTSIIYKRKEIGILRALGARKIDMFKIFGSEGLIISSIILLIVGIVIFNQFIQNVMQTDVVVINIGVRQILLMAAICVVTIIIAGYLPINKIASKKPIDAIRGH